MRSRRGSGILCGTALVLIATVTSALATAPDESAAAIEARVPLPEPADVPLLTPANIGAPTGSAAPTPAAPAQRAQEPAKDTRPALASSLSAADLPVAEKLRDVVTGRLDRLADRRKERSAIETFYVARGFAPLWIENTAANARAKAAIARLKAADADGLDPSDYRIPDFGDRPEQLAEAEIRLTLAALTYARHAQSGRVHPSRFASNTGIDVNPPVPEPTDILAKIAEAKDVAAALEEFNPPHAGYKALRAKLADVRGRSSDKGSQIPGGPQIRPGTKDERIPLIREKLGRGDNGDTTYDAKLVEAVKAVQQRARMKPTGIIGNGTIDALNGPRRDRDAGIIISNMERWRWLPRDLGQTYVMLNIPEFAVRIVNGGKTTFQTRVVVGKPTTPTPVFSDAMENIVVNPTWHVPESIIYGEYLPAMHGDPAVLERMGLQMDQNADGSIAIRQPPGPKNALGRIKFNFPNRHAVYMHDTPDKHLFAHDKRSYSHGCMRIQNPSMFGEVLLSHALPGQGYTAARLEQMYGTTEHQLKFRTLVPVHITYMNAYVDDAGTLVIREDLYGIDGRLQAALRDEDRRVADIAVPQRQSPTSNARAAYYAQFGNGNFFGNGLGYSRPPGAINGQRYYREPSFFGLFR